MAVSYLKNVDIERKARAITSAIMTGIKTAAKETTKSATKLINAKTRGAFETAVKEFYADPKFSVTNGGYDRSFSMYDMLVLEERKVDDMIQPWYGFDDSKMSSFDTGRDRTGHRTNMEENGLFDQVFVKGWHGGADRIDSGKVKYPFQAHPSPGTPYYRTPIGYYRYWGKRAAILNPSPYDRFIEYRRKAIENVQPTVQKVFDGNLGIAMANEIKKLKWR